MSVSIALALWSSLLLSSSQDPPSVGSHTLDLVTKSRSENPNVRLRALDELIDRPERTRSVVSVFLECARDPRNAATLQERCLAAALKSKTLALEALIEFGNTGKAFDDWQLSILVQLVGDQPTEIQMRLEPAVCETLRTRGFVYGAERLLKALSIQTDTIMQLLLVEWRAAHDRHDTMQLAKLIAKYSSEKAEVAREWLAKFDRDQELFLAARMGDTQVILQLVAAGADLDAPFVQVAGDLTSRHDAGLTPLMAAVVRGDLSMVRFLLRTGSDVEKRVDGISALRTAVERGHGEITEILVAEGAQEDPKQILANTNLIRTIGGLYEEAGRAPAWPGVPRGESSRESIAELLGRGADPNSRDKSGVTALMYAANLGLSEAVETLLEAGANPLLESKSGITAMSLATRSERSAVVAILHSHGLALLPDTEERELDRVPGFAFPLYEVIFGDLGRVSRVEIRNHENQVLHTLENPENYIIRETCVVLPLLGMGAARVSQARELVVSTKQSPTIRQGTSGLTPIAKRVRSSRCAYPQVENGVWQVLDEEGVVEFQMVFGGNGFSMSPDGTVQLD